MASLILERVEFREEPPPPEGESEEVLEGAMLYLVGEDFDELISCVPLSAVPMNNVDWNDQIEKVRGDWLDKCHVTPEQKNLVADLLIIYRELSGLSEDADSDLYEDLTDWLRWICRERAGSEDCEEDLQALSRWFRDTLGQLTLGQRMYKEYAHAQVQTEGTDSDSEQDSGPDCTIGRPSPIYVDVSIQTEADDDAL
ncbi:hypothetical protein OH76DRAFT_1420959 [Lentinus brumalis]|uniref:Pre-rRNA-processing protein TSR2 n=1 Tax=Lentinus brumalis TaxID=2498619 RepID=A0A371CY83_9APHY|nr:hypothetical protein OH76DRAFT_1420959 [Polyporus brumalis]